jgi:predicted nuclease of predicted toxin-antitoxin system
MPAFLLDENVHSPDYIIERCAKEGIEVARVHQFGLDETDDPIIFQYALEEGYIFVTANIRDFRAQAIEWMEQGNNFAGAIWLQWNKYRNVEDIIRKIIEVARTYENDVLKEWWLD